MAEKLCTEPVLYITRMNAKMACREAKQQIAPLEDRCWVVEVAGCAEVPFSH